jgi:hypothetical protein
MLKYQGIFHSAEEFSCKIDLLWPKSVNVIKRFDQKGRVAGLVIIILFVVARL